MPQPPSQYGLSSPTRCPCQFSPRDRLKCTPPACRRHPSCAVCRRGASHQRDQGPVPTALGSQIRSEPGIRNVPTEPAAARDRCHRPCLLRGLPWSGGTGGTSTLQPPHAPLPCCLPQGHRSQTTSRPCAARRGSQIGSEPGIRSVATGPDRFCPLLFCSSVTDGGRRVCREQQCRERAWVPVHG